MPSINDLSNIILDAVCEYFNIALSDITSKCSTSNVVDARQFAVYLLSSYGYRTCYIAELIGVSARYVNYIISIFDSRINQNTLLRNAFEIIKNNIRSNSALIT